MNNPFSVKTPETLKPSDIASLFVDVFSDFPRLLEPEHTFLHGARGTGKSMMLRYLEPQVQIAASKVEIANELMHYAVHLPIKKANYSLSELERLKGAPYWLMSEHILIINAVVHVLRSLEELALIKDNQLSADDANLLHTEFLKLIDRSSFESLKLSDATSIESLRKFMDQEHKVALDYLRTLTFTSELVPYAGSLYGYADFFIPFIGLIKSLEITPSGPIYLMMDDADNLPIRMQQVVNSWVSYRTTDQLCLKVSTQLKYKTWRTVQGDLIESPHDYSEIDINNVYTSKQHGHYFERVHKVVERRLAVNGFSNVSPEVFFPKNPKQEMELLKVKEKIKSNWEKDDGVSSRSTDDVTRYSSSEYMKILAKDKKKNHYSYSGFRSIVDLSSGMIRYFLEPAARMYADVSASSTESTIECIPYQTQDKVLAKWSEEFLLADFEKLKNEEGTADDAGEFRKKAEKLRNLIDAIGTCFQTKLLSDDSERRYISFMPSSKISKDVEQTLDLAVEWGYLHRSSIARKEGIGRNQLFILNRRLAPYYKLDAAGYAAHLSVTPEHLDLALQNPKAFVKERLKNIGDGGHNAELQQALPFDGQEDDN